MQEELQSPAIKKLQEPIMIESDQEVSLQRKKINFPLQTQIDIQPIQQHIFQLPYNKTHVFLVVHQSTISGALDKLLKESDPMASKSTQIHKMEFPVRDGRVWAFDLSMSLFTENTIQFYMDFESKSALDDSKAYRIATTLHAKDFKKTRDGKKSSEQKNKSCGYGINLNIDKLTADGAQVCFEIDVTVETAMRYNSREEVGFTGLVNTSSTCYMNSVFQILFNLNEFRRMIFLIQEMGDQWEFPSTLQNLFYSLMTHRNPVSTQEIIRSFKWDYEEQTIQHDVHEFTMELLKGIENRLSNQKPLAKSIIDLFQGELENHIQGINANFDNINIEQFMDIQLHIEGCGDIRQSFQMFAEKETLDGENSIQTEQFGKQAAYKYHLFTKLPPVLILNLKRYRYNMQDGGLQKINDRFEYFETIDMQPYMSKKYKGSMMYRLYGVLVHRGELIHHGHYFCFLRNKDQWLKFDDRVVTKATPHQVFDNNFGGTYRAGEWNNDLNQVILTEENCPETAYMLVYIEEARWKQIFKTVEDADIPNWIQQKEQEQNKRNELKNFIQIPLLCFTQLQHFSHQPQSLRNGLLYHKPAINSEVDCSQLDEEVSKLSLELTIPKNFTHDQTYAYLADVKVQFDLDIQQLRLFLYRIPTQKEKGELIQFIPPSSKKQIQTILNQKMVYKALFLTCTGESQQYLLDQNYKTLLEKGPLEYQESLIQKGQMTITDEQVLVVIKEYEESRHINFFQCFVVSSETTSQQVLNMCYDRVKDRQTQYQLNFLYFDGYGFSIIEDVRTDKSVKELLAENKWSYLTVLVDLRPNKVANGKSNGVHKTKLMDWVREAFEMREVKLKENTISAKENVRILNRNSTYWDLVNAVSEMEGYPPNHIMLKYKEKKGSFVQMKIPSDEFEDLGSRMKQQKQKSYAGGGRLEDFIQNDSTIIYKHTAVSVYDLKTQFAINYEVCPLLGEQTEYRDIICSRDKLIDDLMQQALNDKHLNPLLEESITNVLIDLDGGDQTKIASILMKKKHPFEVLIGSGCQYSLAKLKASYSIAFVNRLELKKDEVPLNLVIKLQSNENVRLMSPIFLQTTHQICADEVQNYLLELLSKRPFVYMGETFTLSTSEVQINSTDGRVRKVPQETTIFVVSEIEEKFVKSDERNKPLNELFPDILGQSMECTIVFTQVCDIRSQRLRQQGVCLNL